MKSHRSGWRWLTIAAPAATAAIGSVGSRRAPEVYSRLRKPAWAPPGQIFGPVWTALYAAIGAAGWRLQRHGAGAPTWALHATQLALNAAWPFAFFTGRDRRLALAVVAALDGVVAAEVATAARVDPASAVLLAPYLGWSLFATALTAAVGDPDAAD